MEAETLPGVWGSESGRSNDRPVIPRKGSSALMTRCADWRVKKPGWGRDWETRQPERKVGVK